jgi:hypothetical protein
VTFTSASVMSTLEHCLVLSDVCLAMILIAHLLVGK